MTTDFNNVLKRKKLNIKDVLDEKALKELVVRVTNKQQYADKFEFIKVENDADFYSIYDKHDRIVIEATNGVSAAAGINYYLTEICHAYFGPITQNINLDDVPPSVGKKHTQTSVFIYRYFMNYCTYSYTMLYAGWEEYERLTDWMLLNGVNLVLNIVGNEIVMRDMLVDVGYTPEEAVNYITGPAYLPWQMMGNMSEFGGNLPSWWFEKQKLLGNRINQKLMNFGVGIIMPGFYGLVPPDLNEKYPDANVIKQGVWCDAFESPAIVSDKDPMFDTFSESFYRNTKKHFGSISYFSGDPFHESGCKDGIVVNEYGKKIVSSMKEHNSDGVWFFQGWQENPTFELIKDINKEDMLIGFLSADRFYANQKGFYGYPWMYISTPNFGGNRVMNGNIKGFMTEPFDIIKNHSEQLLVGNGMAMEGIELDEIIYDAFGYMNFKKECPDVDEFAKIDTDARYGTNNAEMKKAYKQMIDKVYVLTDELLYSGNESVLCARPDIDAQCVTYWGSVPEGYSLELLNDLVDSYLSQYEELKDNECYRLEFLDLSRQLIAEKGRESLKKIQDNFTNHQYVEYKEEQERFFKLIDLDEELLSTNDKTNINNWVKRAEDYAEDEKDKAMLVFNAKNLLMLWASVEGSSLLHDYAYREWCGIMQHYKNRWKFYFEKLDECFDSGEKPNIDFTQLDLEFAKSTYVCINSDKELNELVKASIAI